MTEQDYQIRKIETIDNMLVLLENASLDLIKRIINIKREVQIVKERIEAGRQSDHHLN
jgi:vacuolar-type H+-ATPase subunit D/Vma8